MAFNSSSIAWPDKLYRYMNDPDHVDQFVSGKIYLSTLDKCRRHENKQQRDVGEGMQTYNSGAPITGDISNPEFAYVAAMSGIEMDETCKNNTITNNTVVRSTDGYVLCMTSGFAEEKLTDDFGKHCAEINNPEAFFLLLNAELLRRWQTGQGQFGPIVYKQRHFTGTQQAPGRPAFVKPPDQYEDQQEFRFFWPGPRGQFVSPGPFTAPGLAEFCRRIA